MSAGSFFRTAEEVLAEEWVAKPCGELGGGGGRGGGREESCDSVKQVRDTRSLRVDVF